MATMINKEVGFGPIKDSWLIAVGNSRTISAQPEWKKKLKDISEPKSTPYFADYAINKINKIEYEIRELKEIVNNFFINKPDILPCKIYNLPSDKYKLKNPIDIIIKFYPDETLAIMPNLELYGEGNNELEALNDLKLEIIDLIEDLQEIPDDQLGDSPKAWKDILKQLVEKCE